MLPKYHILIGLIFSFLIALIFNLELFQFLIIFSSSVLIDLDHYFRYICKTKNISPLKFWKWSMLKRRKWFKLKENQKKKYKHPIFIFHGIECWILLGILSFFNYFFLFVLLGFLIHLIPDYIELFYRKEPFMIKFSQIYTWQRNKNKEEFNL